MDEMVVATMSPIGSGWWNDPTQWDLGRVPTSDDMVVIPAGSNIHLRGDCRARNIIINGRVGFIPDANFNLTAEWIMVMGPNAKLDIGNLNNPYLAEGTITLTGEDDGDSMMGMGDKFLVAMNGGSIRLHGKRKLSWTQLDATAAAGSSQITLKENVDWEVGDRIVIASTDFDMHHAEVRTITSVTGSKVTLNAPLQYKHFGKLQTYTRPDDPSLTWTLDERAEVGLLSRNLTIQGDAGSETTGFGGHIMAMPGTMLKADNIELYRMGQQAKLGRYPWHWHSLGDGGQGQYLQNSSIHHTYNRAVTIHSTNSTRVNRNVAYDNLGHAFFFEDGNEVNNVMQYNLGLVTRRPSAQDALLPSDIDDERNMSGPATFWITHPLNKINFNHAAGSDGSGIWFAPHQNANSGAFVPGLNPNNIPVPQGNWDNNVAHSSKHGLLVGPTVFPNDTTQKVNPNLDYYPSQAPGNAVVTVKNYTLFKNLLGAYLRVGQSERDTYWENFVVADNYKGEALTWAGEMHRFLWVGGSENYEPYNSGNFDAIGGASGLVHMHTIYDGPTRIYDSYFADVDRPEMSLFDQWGANLKFTGHTLTNTTVAPGSFNVSWRNFPNRPVWNNAVVYDVDGKVTGRRMTAMHLDIPILRNETTTLIKPDRNGAKSNNRYAYVEVAPSDESSGNKRQRSVTERSDGIIQEDNFVEIEGVSIVPIMNRGYAYTLTYEDYLPWRNRIDYYSMNAGEDMILGFPGAPSTASAFLSSAPGQNSVGARLPEVNSLELLKNTNQSACAFDGTTFYVKYIADSNAKFEDFLLQNSVLVYTDYPNQINVSYSDGNPNGPGVCPVEVISFGNTALAEARTASLGSDISISAVTGSTSCGGSNEFTVSRVGNGTSGFADFHYFPSAFLDWSEATSLSIEMCGGAVEYVVFVGDNDSGYSRLGEAVFGGNFIALLPTDKNSKDQINDIIIRVQTQDLTPNQSVTFNLKKIEAIRELNLDQYIAVNSGGFQKRNSVSVCDGDRVLLDMGGIFGSDWNFTFTRPDGQTIGGGANGAQRDQILLPTIQDGSVNEGEWTVTYTDPEGCSHSESFTITVSKSDLDQYIGVNSGGLQKRNSVSVCDGDRVLLDMGGTFGSDWNFTFTRPDGQTIGGGANGAQRDQILLPTIKDGSVNEGQWQVTYISPEGCSNRETFTINVNTCSGANDCTTYDSESFESGLGLWIDGGTDAIRGTFAQSNTGANGVRLRDNSGRSSSIYTRSIDFSQASSVLVSFSVIAVSMESGEDFMLEVSTDGGNSFSTIKSWASGTDFTNNVRFSVNERINASGLSNTTVIRIRCDASTNHDFIYLDDVLIENCSGGVISCTLEGQLCDDGDPCTQGETYDSDCNCNGGIFMDQDEDGYCAAEDPNDNDPCVPDNTDCGGGSDCTTYDSESFESGLGLWIDGGTDAIRGTFAQSNTGANGVRLRDNSGRSSSIYTRSIDFSQASSVLVSFSVIAVSMEPGEDFMLEVSTDGGNNFSTIKSWASGTDFTNNVRFNINERINATRLSNTTVIRIRCDASTNHDFIYLDDVLIENCIGGLVAQNIQSRSIETSEAKGVRLEKEIDIEKTDIETSYKIYPNPAYASLIVEIEDVDASAVLINNAGQMISQLQINARTDISYLRPGIYCVVIKTGDKVIVRKIVKL
jgi:hypothetical protein